MVVFQFSARPGERILFPLVWGFKSKKKLWWITCSNICSLHAFGNPMPFQNKPWHCKCNKDFQMIRRERNFCSSIFSNHCQWMQMGSNQDRFIFEKTFPSKSAGLLVRSYLSWTGAVLTFALSLLLLLLLPKPSTPTPASSPHKSLTLLSRCSSSSCTCFSSFFFCLSSSSNSSSIEIPRALAAFLSTRLACSIRPLRTWHIKQGWRESQSLETRHIMP